MKKLSLIAKHWSLPIEAEMNTRLLIASLILIFSHQGFAEQLTLSLQHEGYSRAYLLYLPTSLNPQVNLQKSGDT